jgi:hypothetical protein
MKKYLIALLPFIICSILALIYGNLEPKVYSDPTYPYRTSAMLQYLSSRWLIIGAVVSILFLILVLMEDASKWIEKKLLERRIKKDEKNNRAN